MSTQRLRCVLIIPVLAGLLVIGSSTGAVAQDVQAIIDARVEAELAPAIAVGIVRKDGTKEFYFAGTLHAGGTKEVDEDTIFEIGSISKVFTTLLLAQMEEEGDLELSDHAQAFLPAGVTMPKAKASDAQAGETPPKHVTLEHLATHTSGLPRVPNNFKPSDPSNPYADYTFQQMYDFLSNSELEQEIGGQPVYSNLGMGLLGHALERESGKNYDTLLVTRICRPLGMRSTNTKPRRLDQARVAGAHQGVTPVSGWDIPTLAGAGDINSTINDMLVFTAANLGQIDTPMANAMRRCHAPRVKGKIGLGWQLSGTPDTQIIWHNGGTGGFASFMGFRPDTGEGVVVLSNGSYRGVDRIGFHLLNEDNPLDEFQKPAEIDASILEDYVGTYALAPKAKFTIKIEDDRLMARLTGQPFFPVYPVSTDRFAYRVVDAQLTFLRDRKGKVDRLILHQNGAHQEFKKTN